ncbi:MAG TPA: hypothetical protein VEY31_11095 [Roseococcus sp.]|nr:hypothetical protein [Roseococcus sp.]
MTRAPEALRELARAAVEASDAQLIKLVRAVDALPERGAVDALLQPVRERLRALQPRRPLNLPRLLFLPLDPLVVAPRDWRPGAGQVPRSAIAPLAAALAASVPGLAAEIGVRLAGHGVDAVHLIGREGTRLWQAGAAFDPRGPVPGWGDTGLSDAAHVEILALARAVWRHAGGLWRLRLEGPRGPPVSLARDVLREAAAEGPPMLGLALTVTMPFAAQPSRLAMVAAGLTCAVRQGGGPAVPPALVAEQALDRVIAALDPGLGSGGLGSVAQAAERLAGLIEDLQATATPGQPARGGRLRSLRHAAAQSCLRHLEGEAGGKLALSFGAIAQAPELTDAAVAGLEASMTALRSLADAARRLDHAAAAEAALRPAIATLHALLPGLPATGAGLRRSDALRLLELLEGPEGAASLVS